jgi:hypothetical protein
LEKMKITGCKSISLMLVLVVVFNNSNVFAQCNNVPVVPATTPAHALLPTDGNLPNGSVYSLVSASQSITNNITPTGVSTIHINAGRTLTIGASGATRNFNNGSGSTTIYIRSGGTLTVNGDLNGTTIYVYGTLNVTGNLNNTNNIYVATSGIFNATGSNVNINDSNLYVEGSMNVINTLNQFQSSRACMNRGGCIRANNVKTVNTTNFHNTVGNGVFYYSGSTCDFAGSNNNLTSDAGLKICANFAGPCSRLGNGIITYNCNPSGTTCAGAIALPIILAYFNSEKTSEGIRLTWATVYQSNTTYFIIEKSTNGIDWEEVGRKDEKHIQNGIQEYSITDYHPISGQTYYRLKEVDTHNKATVYAVILEDFSVENVSFSLYPNPSNQYLNVLVSDEFPTYDMQIIDSRGMLVATKKLSAGENIFYNLVSPGLYVAKLKIGPDFKVQKFIIK